MEQPDLTVAGQVKLNGKKFDDKNENQHLSGKLVTIVTLGVLAVLIITVALFMSLYKPGVEEKPHFTTDKQTETTTTSQDTQISTDPYSRKKGYYTFLIAGTDVISNNTDVLMMASLDTVKGEVNIVQIPRDTFVNKTVGGYQTVTRVNSVYAAAYNRSTASGSRGATARHVAMKDLKARLEASLCVNLDYYALVSTSSFRKIVDAIGGVWFDVPEDMDYDDPEQGLSIHLKKGNQLLDGKAAEGLIRFRSGYAQGDLDRVSVRANFLRAMMKQVKENLTADALATIVSELLTSVDSSVSLTDAVYFAKQLYSVSSEKFTVTTLSGSSVMNPQTGAWSYYVINKNNALADINKYLNVFSGDIAANLFDSKGFFTDSENEAHAYINNYYLS